MSVRKWKQTGKCYIWKYAGISGDYSGWHFTCDEAASESIVDLLKKFKLSASSVKQTVRLTTPTMMQLLVPNSKYDVVSEDILLLELSSDPEKWILTKHNNVLNFEIGSNKLETLISAIEGVSEGKGDYAINGIWFWWNLD